MDNSSKTKPDSISEVWILTNSFPYQHGEEFLETEIQYWTQKFKGNIIIFPLNISDHARELPEDIRIDLCLAQKKYYLKIFATLQALLSSFFLREIIWLKRNRKLTLLNVWVALRITALILYYRRVLSHKRRSNPHRVVIGYSYWFDIAAYACSILRYEGQLDYLITRAHGYDVYEERHPRNYMPLKRQFVDAFDCIFAISERGRAYLAATYAIPGHKLRVARLGVIMPQAFTEAASPQHIEVISLAYCVAVKQLERIIDALALAAQQVTSGMTLHWVHIGDGPLKHDLEVYAHQHLDQYTNVRFQFLGQRANAEVLRYLATNPVDVIVNSSSSEGVPVSLMEAMSYGIPAIAPAVGGIPEIVSNAHGRLLSANPSSAAIAEAILAIEHLKNKHTRQAAKEYINTHYNAQKNYTAFVQEIANAVEGTVLLR
jgi:colanic acid/amylovoran biosynthesis glycosyltransferase